MTRIFDLEIENFLSPTAGKLFAAAAINGPTGAPGVIAEVPEPGSLALLASLLLGAGVAGRRVFSRS